MQRKKRGAREHVFRLREAHQFALGASVFAICKTVFSGLL
jgi:hypothetical protein